jgi:hypothetical protein
VSLFPSSVTSASGAAIVTSSPVPPPVIRFQSMLTSPLSNGAVPPSPPPLQLAQLDWAGLHFPHPLRSKKPPAP